MKRVISFALALLLTWSLIGGLVPSASAASWAEPYLQNLVGRDIMKGDKTGDLYPDRMITRAEFAALLNRAFGFNQKGATKFSDVPATSWYASDISIAAYQGYMQGDGKGANPSGNLTREQAAAMLCRAIKIAPSEGESFNLVDERNFSNWSRGYINAAVDKRFVSGYPDGSFQPTNNITRGEAAKMLSEVAGEVVSAKTNHTNGVIRGNVTIASSEVTLSNVTILGDLYITEGVGLGYVNLRNVSVNGEVIISGAGESNIGESSVILTDCSISNLTVDVAKRKILTLKTDRTTSVENSLIKSSTYLEELSSNYEGFDKVVVNGPSGTFLNLTGSFADVRVVGAGATLGLYKGKVSSIAVDETAKGAKIFLEKDTYTNAMYFDTGATVSGTGAIDSVLINNDGVTMAQSPSNIYIRPSVTAKINGKTMGSLDAEMDGLAPDFLYGYPKAALIQPVSFTEYYMTNKPGKVYYATYDRGIPAPSADDLIAKNGPPKNAIKFGNLSSLPEKEISAAVSGLKAGKEYVTYSLFVDLKGEKSDVERTYVETVDNVMPTLLSGYPKLSGVDRDKAFITLLPNKDTSYYWAVFPAQAVAPTTEQLYAQNLSGALSKGITRDGITNTPKDIDTSIGGTLQESVPYVFYVILRDSAENMSKTPYKLPFTTKDLTAPAFQPADMYPKVGLVTATAIPVDFMVDEACTLYWSAAKMGSNVLPKLANGDLNVTSQKSKDIVKSGTGVVKYGKSSAAKSATKYSVSVSGLEQQMPYDIYFLLEDKNGNQSEIKILPTKTKDVIPPTVEIDSPQNSGGKFRVDAPVVMTFSEVVCGSEMDKDGNYLSFTQLFKENNTALAKYIKLIDCAKVQNAGIDIKWDYVTVGEVNAKTIITFRAEALGLSNNNSYRFDLNNQQNYTIYDTSKNAMKGPTSLPFKTVPPLTYFSEVHNFDSSKYDVAFFINPQAKNTGANIYFDILLRSDHYIEFELYQGTDINNLQAVEKNGVNKHVLHDNFATRFTDYFATKTEYQSLSDTYYAIKLTKVDSTAITTGQTPITANVNLILNAVIGNETGIRQLAGEKDKFEERLKEAIQKNLVSSVTAPSDAFDLRIALLDNVPPEEVGETAFKPGDRQVLMSIQATKGCTVYYYAVPKTIAPTSPITDPNIVRTQRSDPKQGTAAGFFQIQDNSAAPTQYTIEGLLPPDSGQSVRNYVIYYYLQGKASTPSGVYLRSFETTPVKAPKIVKALESFAGDKMVKITGSWDSDCTMYYVVYPANSYTPSEDEIMGKVSSPDQITSGSLAVKADTEFPLEIKEIEYKYRYDIFAVAQKYIGTAPAGEPSAIVKLGGFTSRDNEEPNVLYDRPETTITKVSADKMCYNGTVMVQFTEGLYYFKQGTADTLPLADDVLKTNLKGNWIDPATITVVNSSAAGGDGAVQQVTFKFDLISDGTTITFGQDIGDKTGNRSGQFKMTFRATDENGIYLTKPYWEAGFLG